MAKFPLSGGRRGPGRRQVPVICPRVTLATVRELEHTRRGGICTVGDRSATVILPLRGKRKSRQQAAAVPSHCLPLGFSCSAQGFRQSRAIAPAVPACLLFVLMRSSNRLRTTSDDVLYRSAGALPVCMVTCTFEQNVLQKIGTFIKAQIIGPRVL